MPVNLRRNQAGPLSSDQADESLEFLSSVVSLAGNSQLQSGGTYYQQSGNYTHVLPGGRSSSITLTVGSGTATLLGVVDGQTNPRYGPGPERAFRRVAGTWYDVSVPVVDNATRRFATRTTGGPIYAPLTWMTNSDPATLVLPAVADDGDTFGVRRGDALVSVVVEGGALIVGVDHATETTTRRAEVRLGYRHRLAEFVRIGGEWRVGE